MKNIIAAKRWHSRLKGKDAAIRFREICKRRMVPNEPFEIDMTGVKNISEGFAYECFGPLYLEAKRNNIKLTFPSLDEELQPILLMGITDYYNTFG